MKTAVFKTRIEAAKALAAFDRGIYHLQHGEHSRPDYTVRKVRNGEGYEIYRRRHYYIGTLNTKPNGPLTEEEIYHATN